MYKTILGQKRKDVLAAKNRLVIGLDVMEKAQVEIVGLQKQIDEMTPDLIKTQKVIAEVLVVVNTKKAAADIERDVVSKEAAAAGKKKKKVAIAMSLVMLEVKPLDDTTNLDDLAQKLFSEITQDGLFWKTEYKKEPVAYGIFKLIVGFSLEDEKVSVDNIVERIEGIEDMVQSVEIAVFNKI